MTPRNLIEYLRSRSSQTKGRIFSITVLVAALGLGYFWVNGIKYNIGGFKDMGISLNPSDEGQVLSAVNHVTIESTESREGKKYLYFKAENNTSDILNFPTKENITLTVNGEGISPDAVLDRQLQPFVLKVLSNTTDYGVMVFPDFDADEGDLSVDGMYFEQVPEKVFKQDIYLDFEELKPLEELRS
jgi:hypothetical protein